MHSIWSFELGLLCNEGFHPNELVEPCMSAQGSTFSWLLALRELDLWFGEADLTSEGQMRVVMGATRRVHRQTRRVESGLPSVSLPSNSTSGEGTRRV